MIYKLPEPLYNLRSKRKITTIDDLTRNALVVADNPGGSKGRDEIRNDKWNKRWSH